MLTATEVEAAAILAKGAAAAKADAKAATKVEENTRAAIENSIDKTVPSPIKPADFSEDSDPEVQKAFQEQENYEKWQRQQYTYSVSLTHANDRNMYPLIYVYLVFIRSLILVQ